MFGNPIDADRGLVEFSRVVQPNPPVDLAPPFAGFEG